MKLWCGGEFHITSCYRHETIYWTKKGKHYLQSHVDKAFKEQIYGDISQLWSHLLKIDASEGVHQSTKQQNYTSWLTMQLPIGTKRKKGDQIIKVL